jgi:hypothetical protein
MLPTSTPFARRHTTDRCNKDRRSCLVAAPPRQIHRSQALLPGRSPGPEVVPRAIRAFVDARYRYTPVRGNQARLRRPIGQSATSHATSGNQFGGRASDMPWRGRGSTGRGTTGSVHALGRTACCSRSDRPRAGQSRSARNRQRNKHVADKFGRVWFVTVSSYPITVSSYPITVSSYPASVSFTLSVAYYERLSHAVGQPLVGVAVEHHAYTAGAYEVAEPSPELASRIAGPRHTAATPAARDLWRLGPRAPSC